MNEANTFNMQHVHEILGSTLIAERCDDPHNHRFATVSGEAIPYMGSHVHRVTFLTDSYDGHIHEFSGTSSPAIPVGDGSIFTLRKPKRLFRMDILTNSEYPL